ISPDFEKGIVVIYVSAIKSTSEELSTSTSFSSVISSVFSSALTSVVKSSLKLDSSSLSKSVSDSVTAVVLDLLSLEILASGSSSKSSSTPPIRLDNKIIPINKVGTRNQRRL